MDNLQEFEIRLLNAAGQVTLVSPVIVPGEREAKAAAAALAEREDAAGYLIRPQLRALRAPIRMTRREPD